MIFLLRLPSPHFDIFCQYCKFILTFAAPAASLANQNADINFMYFTYVYFVIYYFLLRVFAAFDDFNTTP